MLAEDGGVQPGGPPPAEAGREGEPADTAAATAAESEMRAAVGRGGAGVGEVVRCGPGAGRLVSGTLREDGSGEGQLCPALDLWVELSEEESGSRRVPWLGRWLLKAAAGASRRPPETAASAPGPSALKGLTSLTRRVPAEAAAAADQDTKEGEEAAANAC